MIGSVNRGRQQSFPASISLSHRVAGVDLAVGDTITGHPVGTGTGGSTEQSQRAETFGRASDEERKGRHGVKAARTRLCDTLPQVIAAYTFAKDGRNQGTLTLAQTALETLAWAVLGVRNMQLSRSAFDKLPAAERIRMLLNWAGFPTEVPGNLSRLAAGAQSLEDHKDGPQAMVWTRNQIVHPARSSDRRSMMREISLESNYLALRYLELTLLRLFNHHLMHEGRSPLNWGQRSTLWPAS